MAENTLAPTTKIDVFKNVINSPQLRAMVKNSLKEKSGAFLSSMLDLYTGETDLQKYNPEQVAMQCIKAATLDLSLVKSLGQAYVVPYKGVPTFIIGYKGFIQLAERTGKYSRINADSLYEGEIITENRLTGDLIISGKKTSDKAIGYFAYFKLTEKDGGFEKALYMSKEDMTKWGQKYSAAFNNGPWKTEFDKMAIKTVLKRLIGKYGPLSSGDKLTEAFKAEERNVENEIEANANRIIVDLKEAGADIVTDETVQPNISLPEMDFGDGD